MRASRQTVLAAEFPLHAVTGRLGNTPQIVMKHYLMTTNADFAKAVEPAPGDAQRVSQNCMREKSASPRSVGQAKQVSTTISGVCEGLRDAVPPPPPQK